MPKRSRHLVDPELLAVLDAQPELRLTAATLPDLRIMLAAQTAALATPADATVNMEEITVPATARTPALRILAHRPAAQDKPLPAILHIHGGGYVIGGPKMNDAANRTLASDLNCAIFSVDYRLAPETRHPGPVEDCYAA